MVLKNKVARAFSDATKSQINFVCQDSQSHPNDDTLRRSALQLLRTAADGQAKSLAEYEAKRSKYSWTSYSRGPDYQTLIKVLDWCLALEDSSVFDQAVKVGSYNGRIYPDILSKLVDLIDERYAQSAPEFSWST